METQNQPETQTTPTPPTGAFKKQLLNIDDVKAITGFSTTTIYDHLKKGIFPKPKRLGRSVRWRLADIENYINS